jgi:hypothetical protein
MRPLLVFAILFVAGCPPQPKPTKLDAAQPPAPTGSICLSNPQVTTGDVCVGKFTVQGYACARCWGETLCVTTDFVYCVNDCSDPLCQQMAAGKR